MSGPAPPITGPWFTDRRRRALYAEGAGIYRIVPAAVCVPRDEADVIRLVLWARETGTPLVPRGAGSAMGGGNVGAGVVVDLSALGPRTLAIDAAARTARVTPGVRGGELAEAAREHGLRLPPDPSSARFATLGGMVATNAAGARTVRHGAMDRWVRAVRWVSGDGEAAVSARGVPAPAPLPAALARFERDVAPALRADAETIRAGLPHTTKDTAGYALGRWLGTGDVVDLLVGSEGTLGIATELTLALDAIPAATAALAVRLPGLEALPEAVAALRAAGASAIELLDRTFLDVLVGAEVPDELAAAVAEAPALLLVKLEGEPELVATGALAAARVLGAAGSSVVTALDPVARERLWSVRHRASPILASLPGRRSLQVIEDGCVPVARLADYVRAIRAATARHDVPAVLFGHAGDGHVHVNLLPDVEAPGWEARVAAILDEVTDAVVRLGGTVAGEHGVGRLRAGLLDRQHPPAVRAAMHAVKRAFDPAGILNPGVVVADPAWAGASPVRALKAGTGAAPLPDGVPALLRDIERHARWAEPRWQL